MSYQSESQLENSLLAQLNSSGYDKVSIPDYEALKVNFREQVSLFNAKALNGTPLTDTEFNRLLVSIESKGVFNSAKILRDKQTIEREDGSILYLELFNKREWCKNNFQVTHQTTINGKKYQNRYDVTILINGLPLIQIELKRKGKEFKEAFNQINRYRRETFTGLYNFIQVFVISNGVDTKYFANTDHELMYSHTFYWSDEENKIITRLAAFSDTFLEKCHIAKMIARYMVVQEADKRLMIMRPYQVYGAERIIKQATETANNGYIWHTTGSGKTLTSFKVSKILADHGKFSKVIFLVDRKDLDKQTIDEFNSFSAGSVDTTENTYSLVKQMEDPNRRLILTTIQKLSNAVKNSRFSSIMDVYKNENVAFIIDECHRSQYGDMHKKITMHFAKAQYFGFTGTPRLEENPSADGRGTADLFHKCLHSYLLKDGIRDGNTLPFSVDYIKTFNVKIDETDTTRINGINESEIWSDPRRVSGIAKDILGVHARKTYNRSYNAIFAVSSVPALIQYYDEFKKQQPEDSEKSLKIAAIYTYGANEDMEGKDEHSREALERIIADYNATFGTNFSTDTFAEYFVDVSDRIKKKEIDILLVVNMFLTGFDSKILNTLYVDKNLKHHGLIQAFSRTNRVEKSVKHYGNVRCYRPLKDDTDEAIRIFSKTDSVDTVLAKGYEESMSDFTKAIDELLEYCPTPDAADELEGETAEREFVFRFRALARALRFLQPFGEFDFNDVGLKITEQEFEEFRSKYLKIYDKTKLTEEVESVLADIDFCIEEVCSDKINVDYILHLIRSIDLSDPKKKEKQIEEIRSQVERADTTELRLKKDFLLELLDKIIPNLNAGDDIQDAMNALADTLKAKEIKSFAQTSEVTPESIAEVFSDYRFTGSVDRGRISKLLSKNGFKFLENRKLTTKISDFIITLSHRYN